MYLVGIQNYRKILSQINKLFWFCSYLTQSTHFFKLDRRKHHSKRRNIIKVENKTTPPLKQAKEHLWSASHAITRVYYHLSCFHFLWRCSGASFFHIFLNHLIHVQYLLLCSCTVLNGSTVTCKQPWRVSSYLLLIKHWSLQITYFKKLTQIYF